jgi:hypothetical protein
MTLTLTCDNFKRCRHKKAYEGETLEECWGKAVADGWLIEPGLIRYAHVPPNVNCGFSDKFAKELGR